MKEGDELKKTQLIFTFVTLIIGFMIAIQFQSKKEPIIRDTRDIRELREELKIEQERHQQLIKEIEKTTTLINQYEQSLASQEENIENVMLGEINKLKEQAGLTEATGEGIILTIEPLVEGEHLGQARRTVSPKLLRFLVNELNIYQAKAIAIGNERIVATSAFRDVQGITQVNGRRIPPLPLEVKVLADDAQKLHNEMIVSESVEIFEIENLKITSVPVNELTLPAYNQSVNIRYMEQVKEG